MPVRRASLTFVASVLCGCVCRLSRGCGEHPALAKAPLGAVPHEGACPVFPASNPLNQDISHAPVDPNSAKYIASIGAGIHLHADFGTPPSYGIPYTVVGPPPAQGPGPLRIPRRIRSRPLPDPARRARGGRGRRRRPARARSAGGHVQAVRALRGSASRAAVGMRARARCSTCAATPCVPKAGPRPTRPGFPSSRCWRATRRSRPARSTTPCVSRWPRPSGATSIPPPTSPPVAPTPTSPRWALRLRLKASFDLAGYHGQALVVLRALKRYGLIVADNGSSWYITGAPNPHWNNEDLDQLKSVPGSAFEAVEYRAGPAPALSAALSAARSNAGSRWAKASWAAGAGRGGGLRWWLGLWRAARSGCG